MATFICPQDGTLSDVVALETTASTALMEQFAQFAGEREGITTDQIEINRGQGAQLILALFEWIREQDPALAAEVQAKITLQSQ